MLQTLAQSTEVTSPLIPLPSVDHCWSLVLHEHRAVQGREPAAEKDPATTTTVESEGLAVIDRTTAELEGSTEESMSAHQLERQRKWTDPKGSAQMTTISAGLGRKWQGQWSIPV